MSNPIKLNGNGVATTTGKQLLQIIPVNIVVLFAIVGTGVGLYWKFDSRITSLERSVKILDELSPTIYRTDANVQWLMDKQKQPTK